MSLTVLTKAVVIALGAALLVGLPMSFLLTFDMDMQLKLEVAVKLLGVAFLGSVLVGLPVALLTYQLAGRHLRASIYNVLLAANFAGVMMVLACYAFGGSFAGVFLGLPSVLAVNIYALLGWFWILQPERVAHRV